MNKNKAIQGVVVALAAFLSLLISCNDSSSTDDLEKMPMTGMPEGCETSSGDTGDGDDGEDMECTGEEEYADCVLNDCGSYLDQCFGENWLDGDLGGDCKAYFDCVNACECDDINCIGTCAAEKLMQGDCATCMADMNECFSKCPMPECE